VQTFIQSGFGPDAQKKKKWARMFRVPTLSSLGEVVCRETGGKCQENPDRNGLSSNEEQGVSGGGKYRKNRKKENWGQELLHTGGP